MFSLIFIAWFYIQYYILYMCICEKGSITGRKIEVQNIGGEHYFLIGLDSIFGNYLRVCHWTKITMKLE